MERHTLRGAGALRFFTFLTACLLTWPPLAHAAGATLTETGSTLMLPLLQAWAEGYGKVSEDVKVTTAGTGSGAGIAAAIEGTAQIGASDAYMSDVEVMQHPGVLNIPLAISAQTVSYNLPDFSGPLKLSGPVLAGIYTGTISDWSDSQIAALNPGAALPHHAIVPIRRDDASGDTFIFTQFLSFSTPGWETGPGFGTTVSWPSAPGMLTAQGNDGMVQSLAKTPYGIAYVAASFADQIASAKLGVAQLLNQSGKFVLPTQDAIMAAAAALTPRTPPDQRLTLVFAPGDTSYPLINYDYAIVRTQQASPDQAAALRDFLIWTVTPGEGSSSAYLDPGHFIALPTSIRALSETQIAKLH